MLGGHLLKLALKENGVANYEIKRNVYGKPFLADSKSFKFNISHSGDWVTCMCDNVEVGIDVEKICDIDYSGIAKRFFNKKEYNFLNSCNSRDEPLKFFYRLWTLKESYAKMLGMGLSVSLNSFSVIEDNFIKEQIKNIETTNTCYLKNIEIIKGYELSICCENKKIDQTHKFISLYQLTSL